VDPVREEAFTLAGIKPALKRLTDSGDGFISARGFVNVGKNKS
jgi:hypothetical protein